MSDTEKESSPRMRVVTTRLAVPPLPYLFGVGEAFHKYVFEGREIGQPLDAASAEERVRDVQDRQQDRELPVQYWRGVFLDRFFALDHNLGAAIANHFAVEHESLDEWNHLLLGKVSFNKKSELIKAIIDSRGLDEAFPNMKAYLDQLGAFRNVLAHGMLEPIDDETVTFLYYKSGVFDARKFLRFDLWVNVIRLHAMNWDIYRLSSLITGSENESGPIDLEGVRQLVAVRQGPCPACGTAGAALMYEPGKDAWTDPDFSVAPRFVACLNPACERYEQGLSDADSVSGSAMLAANGD